MVTLSYQVFHAITNLQAYSTDMNIPVDFYGFTQMSKNRCRSTALRNRKNLVQLAKPLLLLQNAGYVSNF